MDILVVQYLAGHPFSIDSRILQTADPFHSPLSSHLSLSCPQISAVFLHIGLATLSPFFPVFPCSHVTHKDIFPNKAVTSPGQTLGSAVKTILIFPTTDTLIMQHIPKQ